MDKYTYKMGKETKNNGWESSVILNEIEENGECPA